MATSPTYETTRRGTMDGAPPNGRVLGLYVGGRSPVKVEKRARRRCLFKTRLFAKLQLVRQRCEPVSALLLERRCYCHRAQRPGGVAITLRHASAKTDIQVARNDSQSARKAIVRRNRAEKRQRP